MVSVAVKERFIKNVPTKCKRNHNITLLKKDSAKKKSPTI
jgi:hypothetical protein